MGIFSQQWRTSGGLRWLAWGGAGVDAAFPTREGGVSAPPFDGLNLGLSVGDATEAALENRRRFAAALGIDLAHWVVPGQVHGTRLVAVGETEAGCGARDTASAIADADALLTSTPGLGLVISHADCVPVVLVAAGETGPLVATVHAGWRGMLAGIVEQAAAALSRRGRLLGAVVGPAIGPCCFTVDEELRRRFDARYPGVVTVAAVDLWACARRQLETSGVPRRDISVTGLCTSCDTRFFSHRRDRGETGRHLAVTWLADRVGAAHGEP